MNTYDHIVPNFELLNYFKFHKCTPDELRQSQDPEAILQLGYFVLYASSNHKVLCKLFKPFDYYFNLAAQLGHPIAIYLQSPLGTKLHVLFKAATMNHPLAQLELGNHIKVNDPKQVDTYMEWYRLSEKSNCPYTLFKLGCIAKSKSQIPTALQYYRLAAHKGINSAITGIADLLCVSSIRDENWMGYIYWYYSDSRNFVHWLNLNIETVNTLSNPKFIPIDIQGITNWLSKQNPLDVEFVVCCL